jgi:hypothetical protein
MGYKQQSLVTHRGEELRADHRQAPHPSPSPKLNPGTMAFAGRGQAQWPSLGKQFREKGGVGRQHHISMNLSTQYFT